MDIQSIESIAGVLAFLYTFIIFGLLGTIK